MVDNFIYSREAFKILFAVNKALYKCFDYWDNSEKLVPENKELVSCFNTLKSLSFDKHIREGIYERHQQRGDKIYPRILKLTINAFRDASSVRVISRFVLPSPLYILYYALIAPEHSQTAAYSLASCRTLLFNILQENFIKHNPKKTGFDILKSINEKDISSSFESLSRYNKIGNRWPKELNLNSRKTFTHLAVGHFLAMKGITHLSFSNINEARKFVYYKDSDSFMEEFSLRMMNMRFRLSNRYEELPDTGELINQIHGIPIPIKGAEVVFFGGIKPATAGGVVIGVTGTPGIGKTSFALALANSVAPLGIDCFYLSLEEDVKDIEKRLFSLQTPFEKEELSIYRDPEDGWFVPSRAENFSYDDFLKFTEKIRAKLTQEFSIIVIDNLNQYITDDKKISYEKIQKIVENLRKSKSIVILIGGKNVLERLGLEYLIDIGIKMVHEDLEKTGEKPLRLFNLYKTRHQLSRQGTHVFHMSGNEGFRLSPQIPSQMDRREKLKRYLPDKSKIIHTLNYLNDDENIKLIEKDKYPSKRVRNEPFIELYPRSQVLIHGYGSAGKAGFGLKLLLTPPMFSNKTSEIFDPQNFSSSLYRRKVLIISFLYSKDYYNDLLFKSSKKNKSLNDCVKDIYKNIQNPIVDYLIYYPGYISAEDFINKITRKLDQAILEGHPFTGVLIDGLHNVFLQFKRLQKNDMVWPLLYNILVRYDMTVVSTFTNFSLNDKLIDDNPNSRNEMITQALPDHMLFQQGMAPFLHALVKASDYYIFLEPVIYKRDGTRHYLLSIKSAIGQNVPTEILEWDRQRNVFVGIDSYPNIIDKINGKVNNI